MGLFQKSSIFYLMLLHLLVSVSCDSKTIAVDVGVVLDFGSLLGITSNASMALAVEDFYNTWGKDYRTRLAIHYRDSQGSAIGAASAGLDLIKSVHVQAIIGPQTSEEADFLVPICSNAHVPIVSFSVASSFHSQPVRAPYFLRMAENDVFQVRAIAAIIEAYSWRDVALVHDDSYGGTILVPYLADALQEVGAHIHHIVISPTTENEVDAPIHQTLVKLSAMGIKVFIVNLPFLLAKSFFRGAVDAGMMVNGYSWILTSQLSNLVGSMDTSMIKSMQGVLGVKTYVPDSVEIEDFRDRWKLKLRRELPDVEILDLDVYVLWAYETVWALALSVENSLSSMGNGNSHYSLWSLNKSKVNFTGLFGTLVSSTGSRLLRSLLATKFKGLSGDIRLVDGQLNTSSVFEIINVAGKGGRVIGYWTPTNGLSQSSRLTGKKYSSKMKDLAAVIWPGESVVVPSGRMTASGSKAGLTIGVPVKNGFKEFVEVEWDPIQQKNVTKGFVPDVFLEVMKRFPEVLFDFFPYDNGHVDDMGYYDELIYQVYLQKFDAVVGDTTIMANRSNYVDFCQPFTDAGITMIVPVVDDDETKKSWWFLGPFSRDLWLATIAMFFLKGFLVWVFERGKNKEFEGKFSQVGKILHYSFTTFVFANKEKLETNYARFIISLWTFVVFVLVTSYGANLTSMLTVQKLRPNVTNLQSLIKNKEFIGYQNGSFVFEFLKQQGADESKLKAYATMEGYADGLRRGSSNDGVAAIMDELPFIRFFLAKYCHNYTMAGQIYRTGGFGFVFPRGSNMIADISRAVIEFSQGEEMSPVEAKWFGNTSCSDQLDASETNYELGLYSFRYIYVFSITASLVTVILYTIDSLYEQSARSRLLSVVHATNAPEQSQAEDTTQPGTAGEVAQNHQVVTIQDASNDATLVNSRSNNVVLLSNPPAREISLSGIPSYTLTQRNFSI